MRSLPSPAPALPSFYVEAMTFYRGEWTAWEVFHVTACPARAESLAKNLRNLNRDNSIVRISVEG